MPPSARPASSGARRLEHRRLGALLPVLLAALIAGCDGQPPQPPPSAPTPPPAETVGSITLDTATVTKVAPGNGVSASDSDNWAITWGADGHQYTTFGDGSGFATDNDRRASLGVARIEGSKADYRAVDIFKTDGDLGPGWTGKSYGLLDISGTLWMWRAGTGSEDEAYEFSRLYRSDDKGASWTETPVQFDPGDFPDTDRGPVVPTFLQNGPGYSVATDGFVYSYFYENKDGNWEVQKPGEIVLARVPIDQMAIKEAYEFFAGDDAGSPTWSADTSVRQPVFTDETNGVMRTSVSYNSVLGKFFLIAQQVSRFRADGAMIGIYSADAPWGPWSEVLFADPWAIGLQAPSATKTVYWNFSNKWLSEDGQQFVLVYTGPGEDEWGTVEGSFRASANSP